MTCKTRVMIRRYCILFIYYIAKKLNINTGQLEMFCFNVYGLEFWEGGENVW